MACILVSTFPSLEHPRLVYPDNVIRFSKSVRWPRSYFEYATHSAGLTKLKSFEFNYLLNPICYPFPIMQSFEDGFGSEDGGDIPAELGFEDRTCVFRTFAAHALSLETLI